MIFMINSVVVVVVGRGRGIISKSSNSRQRTHKSVEQYCGNRQTYSFDGKP